MENLMISFEDAKIAKLNSVKHNLNKDFILVDTSDTYENSLERGLVLGLRNEESNIRRNKIYNDKKAKGE